MNLILLGPPGAGKGTQAVRLAAYLKVPQISTGDILRAARQVRSDLGRKVEGFMLSGQLVPDDVVTELVRERLGQPDASNGYILDGYPRTVAQARSLEEILVKRGQGIDCVLNLEVTEPELVKRLLGRGREDDREEVIRDRLKVYRKQTEPLIGFYSKCGILRGVNALGEMDEIFTRLTHAVNGKA